MDPVIDGPEASAPFCTVTRSSAVSATGGPAAASLLSAAPGLPQPGSANRETTSTEPRDTNLQFFILRVTTDSFRNSTTTSEPALGLHTGRSKWVFIKNFCGARAKTRPRPGTALA